MVPGASIDCDAILLEPDEHLSGFDASLCQREPAGGNVMSELIGRRSLFGLPLVPLTGSASLPVDATTDGFAPHEIEALALSARLLARSNDPLAAAASAALDRLARPVAPQTRWSVGLSQDFDVTAGEGDPAALRPIAEAIATRHVLRMLYCDVEGAETVRTIWPIAVLDGARGRLLAAYCALRNDFRHFRLDRVIGAHVGADRIPPGRDELFLAWHEENGWRDQTILFA